MLKKVRFPLKETVQTYYWRGNGVWAITFVTSLLPSQRSIELPFQKGVGIIQAVWVDSLLAGCF